jgi:hypothetical protein
MWTLKDNWGGEVVDKDLLKIMSKVKMIDPDDKKEEFFLEHSSMEEELKKEELKKEEVKVKKKKHRSLGYLSNLTDEQLEYLDNKIKKFHKKNNNVL